MQLEKKNTCRPYRLNTVGCNKQGFTVQSIDSMENTSVYIIKQCLG